MSKSIEAKPPRVDEDQPRDLRCFVISPIGEATSEVRKRSDDVLRYIITPALAPLGYRVTRADEIDESGNIASQIIANIIQADLVVADLTQHNPNVFYELAVRHAVSSPYIQIIDSNETLPFDIVPYRTISFDYRDLASVDNAKNKIMSYAREFLEKPDMPIDTPIGQAISLQPADSERGSAEEMLDSIRVQVQRIERFLRTTEDARMGTGFEAVLDEWVSRGLLSYEQLKQLSFAQLSPRLMHTVMRALDEKPSGPTWEFGSVFR